MAALSVPEVAVHRCLLSVAVASLGLALACGPDRPREPAGEARESAQPATSTPAPPPSNPALRDAPRLPPADEADVDPSFLAFRDDLLRVVRARDRAALLAMVAEDVRVSFGDDGGRTAFIANWGLDEAADGSPLWPELLEILALGGTFETTLAGNDRFWAPYVFSTWPERVDAFTHVAAVVPQAAVRAAPEPEAEVLAVLDFHILELAAPPTVLDDWAHVRLPDGRTGWVRAEEVRSPIDWRAAFERSNGVWRLSVLVAGD